jgi:hypothetical protein
MYDDKRGKTGTLENLGKPRDIGQGYRERVTLCGKG